MWVLAGTIIQVSAGHEDWDPIRVRYSFWIAMLFFIPTDAVSTVKLSKRQMRRNIWIKVKGSGAWGFFIWFTKHVLCLENKAWHSWDEYFCFPFCFPSPELSILVADKYVWLETFKNIHLWDFEGIFLESPFFLHYSFPVKGFHDFCFWVILTSHNFPHNTLNRYFWLDQRRCFRGNAYLREDWICCCFHHTECGAGSEVWPQNSSLVHIILLVPELQLASSTDSN